MRPPDLLQDLNGAHYRHLEVTENDVHAPGANQIQRDSTVFRRQHPIAFQGKKTPKALPDYLFVVHDNYGMHLTGELNIILGTLQGECHSKDGTAQFRVLYFYVSSVLLNDPVDNG